jgi:hypothetical protein
MEENVSVKGWCCSTRFQGITCKKTVMLMATSHLTRSRKFTSMLTHLPQRALIKECVMLNCSMSSVFSLKNVQLPRPMYITHNYALPCAAADTNLWAWCLLKVSTQVACGEVVGVLCRDEGYCKTCRHVSQALLSQRNKKCFPWHNVLT